MTALDAELAPQGARPGFAAVSGIASVVTLVGHDPATFEATFTTPEGRTLTREVAPELRALAAARSPGDEVFVEVLDPVAIGVTEIAR